MTNVLPINPTVTARIDSFIQAAGISPASMRWLLHLTPTEGEKAHITTTLLLQWSSNTGAGDTPWQLLSVTDASGWPDMQRPFQELYVDIEQHQYWYCQGGPLTPAQFTAVFAQWQARFITHHPVALTRADAEALAPAIASPHTAD
ncbi:MULTISPECIES: hypothetical protein [Aeromonas]|uniref:hypothetical protein n=1 Tax=Aeromonas TaxID=642 RepID=UPI00191497D9|nr:MULTISPECIES: hypothetical protein [Aeromonas]QQQ14556.1 hypothetical protein JJL53_05380 [Aeromonas media]HEH9428590.1 hypothetical protein [Aeromonas sobria]